MKKITFILFIMLLSGFGIKVKAVDVPAGADLYVVYTGGTTNGVVYSALADGGVIQLTTDGGAYTWGTTLSTINKSFIIRAASNLTTRPIVTLPAGVAFGNASGTITATKYEITFEGIDFLGAGGGTPTTTHFISLLWNATKGGDCKINMNNCIVRNLTASGYVFYYTAATTYSSWYSDLNVTNSKFIGPMGTVCNIGSQYAGPNNTTFKNCYITGFTVNGIRSAAGTTNTSNSLKVDHCTFYDNFITGSGMEFNVKTTTPSNILTLKNNLFYYSSSTRTAGNIIATGTVTTTNHTNNAVYYVPTTPTLTTAYPTTLLTYATLGGTPTFDGDNYVNNSVTNWSNTGALDGKPYGFINPLTPSTTIITGFTANNGSAGTPQSFTITNDLLQSAITVTGSTNYEVSLSSGSGYAGSVSVASTYSSPAATTVYVRLKNGIAPGSYNSENIVLSTVGVTSKNVTCSGSVAAPTVSSTLTTLTALNYVEGSGPSAYQTFSVSGSNMTGALTITPPASGNYEICTTSGGTYQTTAITFSSANVSATPIYVKLKAGLSAADYNSEVIVVSSTYATSANVTVSGTVSSGSSPAIVSTQSSLTGLNYIYTLGGSAYQSFNVSGTNLTSDIVITPPVSGHYEICLTSGGTYQTSAITILLANTGTPTTIYTRLKAGLAAGNYNTENIVLSTDGATSSNVACSGTVIAPTLNVSGSPLTGFNYVYASGPSTEQTFTVSGSNLNANITVAPSTNYEVSLSSGSGFGSSLSIAPSSNSVPSTTIYVRLKAGLSAASYNTENVVVATNGATSVNVICSGSVTPPTINTSVSTLTGFNYVFASGGPSAEQSFNVSGSNLNASITITPSADFEISTGTGGSFVATNPITLTKNGSNAVASTPIYVRLKAGLAAANYNTENVVVATNGATTQNVVCSGSVTVPTIVIGRAVIVNQTYALGAGPSAGRDISVVGTNLTGNIIVTCPANHEIATDAVFTSPSTTTLTLVPSGNSVNTSIYVRLASGLLADTYTGINVTFASSGATTQNCAMTSNVTGGPVIKGAIITTAVITSVSGLNYAGNGPSTSNNNLKITCSGLTTDVTVTPPTNFEVSLDNTTFQTTPMTVAKDVSGNIATGTTIYVRMKAGLAPNTYNEAITLSAENANTRTVSVSGTVTPLITTSATSISGVTYAGNGPSVERTIDISGSNLTGDITLTPPTYFEISLTSGSGFTLSPIVLTRSGSVVNNTTIYVRMKAGLAIGSYTGENIVCTSASATTKNIGCSGTVTANPAITSFTPTTATNGATVVITGYNFTGASAVSFGATAATSFVVDSDTQITAVVAAGTTGSVSVTTGIGTGTLAGFTYTNNQTIATTATASALTLTPVSNVTVSNGGTLTINQATSINSITIERGGSVSNTSTLTVPTFTINSDANGTGTYVDNGTTTVSGTTTVNQYVTSTTTGVAGRNWYISSPVSAALSSTITNATGNGLVYYAGGSSWLDAGTTMEVMKGYIAKSPAQITTIAFSGGTLNTGPQSVSDLPLGFNLVGNPYPSYLNWTDATKTNISTSIWYRSKSTGSYLFQTYNVAGDGVSVNNGTELIPPMQSFWIKTTSSTNTLGFTNTMRSHQDQSIATNRLKSPKASTQQLLRLQVSNGTNRDEAVVYFNEKAQNTLDTFDSQKMFNNITEVPEIYTQIDADKLVINGMRAIPYDIEMPVGFNTLQSNNFSISATELKNFDADTKIILKDNLLKTEKDITNGQSYEFSSEVANSTSRFSIQFKSASQANGNNNPADDFSNITIYRNENNLITINCSRAIVANGIITICNSVGQKMINSRIISTNSVINTPLESGVYFVTVSAAGNTTTKKVLIN